MKGLQKVHEKVFYEKKCTRITQVFGTKINLHQLVMSCLNRISLEALQSLSHQFKNSHYQSNLKSVQTETNMELTMKLG